MTITNAREDILKRFDELIKEGENLQKSISSENLSRLRDREDLWRRKVEILILRVGGKELLERYNKHTIKIEEMTPFFRTIRNPQERFILGHAVNFLIAIKEDIELFGDEDSEKESNKLKRHFNLKARIPGGIAEAEWGVEDK